MNTIELQRGEQLKVIGQKSVYMILINVDGEIYSKTDSKREIEENNQSHPSNSIVRQVVPSQDKMDDNHSTKQELNKEVLKDYKAFDNPSDALEYLKNNAEKGETIILDERADGINPRRITKFAKSVPSEQKESKCTQ